MGFEPDISSFEPEIPSDSVVFELPGGVPVEVITNRNSFLKSLIKTPPSRKYMVFFNPVWTEDTFSIDSALPEDRLFLIAKEHITLRDGSSMYDYISVEEEEISVELLPSDVTYVDEDGIERSDISKRFFTISYGPKEAEKLISLYGNSVVELQVTLEEDPIGSTAVTTNSIDGNNLTVDSLSSLGPVFQETLVLSEASDLEGEVIERAPPVVTDIGGVTSGY
tara:strand:+ start:435 stop:1103 length:669 start_codon:yes stop_codon:yes gene_type:complete